MLPVLCTHAWAQEENGNEEPHIVIKKCTRCCLTGINGTCDACGFLLPRGCRQGEVAESLYILISGRVRLLRADPDARVPIHVEEEVLDFRIPAPAPAWLEHTLMQASCGAIPSQRHV